MAFGNVDLLKLELGIPAADTTEDNLLTALMGQASTLIENYCDRLFGADEFTEFYSGDGTPILALNQRPVIAIANLWMNDSAFWGQAGTYGTALTQGADYALQIDQRDGTSNSGLVLSINGAWDIPFNYAPGLIYPFLGPGNGNIKVQYTAGYVTIPQDIQLALFMQVAAIRNTKNYGQLLASESLNDGGGANSYSIAAKPKIGVLSPEVCSILARYRNIAVA